MAGTGDTRPLPRVTAARRDGCGGSDPPADILDSVSQCGAAESRRVRGEPTAAPARQRRGDKHGCRAGAVVSQYRAMVRRLGSERARTARRNNATGSRCCIRAIRCCRVSACRWHPGCCSARCCRWCARLHAREAFDAIDAHYFYPDGVAAVWLGRQLGLPVVITARGTDVTLIPRYAVPRRLIRGAIRDAAALISVSAALKAALVELGAPPGKVTVLRNGVDTTLFRPPDDRAAARRGAGPDAGRR